MEAKILEGKVHEAEMDSRDYNWLIKTLSKSCKYPPKLQEKNLEGLLHVAFEVDDQRLYCQSSNPYVQQPKIQKYYPE